MRSVDDLFREPIACPHGPQIMITFGPLALPDDFMENILGAQEEVFIEKLVDLWRSGEYHSEEEYENNEE
jgi:hypothetical protein